MKYGNHPSILATGEVCREKHVSLFLFSKADKKEKYWRTCQDTDVPTKILEENAYLFADLHLSFNASKHNSSF